MSEKVVPIFYLTDDKYVKYINVSLKSLIDHTSDEYKYEVHILHTDVKPETIAKSKRLEKENVSIIFDDVSAELAEIKEKLFARDYYNLTTYYRFFIADKFPQFNKAIYLDGDTIVLDDIANLYNHELGNNLIAGAREQAFVQVDLYGQYVEKVLGVSRNEAINAGVILINTKLFREEKFLSQFIDSVSFYKFVVTQDEDYINLLCNKRILFIDLAWNAQTFLNLPVEEKDLKIIHYDMAIKPWHFADCKLGSYFWKYAEQTEDYQEIKDILDNYTEEQKQKDLNVLVSINDLVKSEIDRPDNYLNLITKDKSRIEVLKKISEFEMEKRFDQDVEIDPPSRTIMPGEVDYLRKKLSSKIKTHFAYKIAGKFLKKILKNGDLIIKDVKGVENFQNLNSGAIITMNHFNAFDSFAAEIAYQKSGQKKRRMYRIIKEGNYTSFPGFYGKLMRNCYTLPLSSNEKTMVELMRAVKTILSDGDFILIYPEQSMWWNYRKPKPLKRGGFQFAARMNVPVLPIFITMEDTDKVGVDGYPIQAYTINIAKPIYPVEGKKLNENIDYMMEENARVWKEIYEDFYKIPLEYKE